MRLLFVLLQPRYVRLFEATIRLLAQRGHSVHLAFQGSDKTDKPTTALTDRLCAEFPGVSAGPAPIRMDRWVPLASALRRGIDYIRYLTPEYASAPKLRARGAREAPSFVVGLTKLPVVRSTTGLAVLDRTLRWLERSLPGSEVIDDFVSEQRPDIVLVTPLVVEPAQADYLRSAMAIGVPTALCVASWDNLTNKGLIRDVPDRVYVWNEGQRREATELHGVAPQRVVATGAHPFDQWFGWRPSTTGEDFRDLRGLSRDGPLLLYVCSSRFVANYEPPFVERWLEGLRAAGDERLRRSAVLVRPHPKTGVHWRDSELAHRPGVAVWPPTGALATTAKSKSDFFDSMYHCAAVVGLNTTALIESTIVGRPGFTIRAPEYEDSQSGTLHFHYLLRENGGPLTVADCLREHFEQLAETLDRDAGHEQRRRFVRGFVRPRGLGTSAAGVLVHAVESQVAERRVAAPERARRRLGQRLTVPALAVLAFSMWCDATYGSPARRRWASARKQARPWRQRRVKQAKRRLKRARRRVRLARRRSARKAKHVMKRVRRWLKASRRAVARASDETPPAPDGGVEEAEAGPAAKRRVLERR